MQTVADPHTQKKCGLDQLSMNLRQSFLVLMFLVGSKGLWAMPQSCLDQVCSRNVSSQRDDFSTLHLFVQQDVSDLVVLHAALVGSQWCALAR